jgi:hypothetical protein
MPLPSVVNGAKLCQGLSKRTKLPCKNPAAFGCRTCRMHGAHQSRFVLSGQDHQNFRHGQETYQARDYRRKASRRLHELINLGNAIGMFNPGTKLRGRKPTGA